MTLTGLPAEIHRGDAPHRGHPIRVTRRTTTVGLGALVLLLAGVMPVFHAFWGDAECVAGEDGCSTSQTITLSVIPGPLTLEATRYGSNPAGTVIDSGEVASSTNPRVLTAPFTLLIVTDLRGSLDGWSLTTRTGDFASGDDLIGAEQLFVSVSCREASTASAPGVDATAPTLLGEPVILCSKDFTTGAGGSTGGRYTVSGRMKLSIPGGTAPGGYSALATLDLFGFQIDDITERDGEVFVVSDGEEFPVEGLATEVLDLHLLVTVTGAGTSATGTDGSATGEPVLESPPILDAAPLDPDVAGEPGAGFGANGGEATAPSPAPVEEPGTSALEIAVGVLVGAGIIAITAFSVLGGSSAAGAAGAAAASGAAEEAEAGAVAVTPPQ